MSPEIVAAERTKEVRDAVIAWRRAAFVSEAVLSRALSLYPDDRQRFGPGFRALAFLFGGFACLVLVGLSLLLFEPRGAFGLSFALGFWAVALAAVTEAQRNGLKRSDAGAESATAYASVVLAVIALVTFTEGFFSDRVWRATVIQTLGAAFAVCCAAAWRWGDMVLFIGATVSGFALLAQTGQGRLLWIAASALLIPVCLLAARHSRLAPSYRRGAVVVGAVSVLALYASVHIWSFDQGLIESAYALHDRSPAPVFLRPISVLLTAALPPVLLILGWRRREPLLLYAGLLLTGVSIATIRLYHSVMPLSLALILIGSVCLALALGVRRWLRADPGGEREGFTADPLFDDSNRTEAIRSVVAVASFTPTAHSAPSRPAFEGAGGTFGGGGATGGY